MIKNKKTEHLTLEKAVILKKTNNSKLMSEDQTTPASIKLKQTVVKKEAIRKRKCSWKVGHRLFNKNSKLLNHRENIPKDQICDREDKIEYIFQDENKTEI